MTEAMITPQKKRRLCDANTIKRSSTKESIDAQTHEEDRYIVIAYAVRPEPDMHRELCFVLYKGMKSDDAMRTYVAAHIKQSPNGWPLPDIEIKKSAGEVMETTCFVEPHEFCAAPCPTLSRHVQERCGHADKVNTDKDVIKAYDFEPPVHDYEKCAVRMLTVSPRHWHRIRHCLDTHRETQCRHTPFVITRNNENGEMNDFHAMHIF